jgi:hypothetical protein
MNNTSGKSYSKVSQSQATGMGGNRVFSPEDGINKTETEVRTGNDGGDYVESLTLLSVQKHALQIPPGVEIVGIGVLVCDYYLQYSISGRRQHYEIKQFEGLAFHGLEFYARNSNGATYTIGHRLQHSNSDPSIQLLADHKILFGPGEYLTSISGWITNCPFIDMNFNRLSFFQRSSFSNYRNIAKISFTTNLNTYGPFGTTGPRSDTKNLHKSFKIDVPENNAISTIALHIGSFSYLSRFDGFACFCICNRTGTEATTTGIIGIHIGTSPRGITNNDSEVPIVTAEPILEGMDIEAMNIEAVDIEAMDIEATAPSWETMKR